jgi:hypothetical protein
MKEEEQRMNSPKLGRRQWNGGERTEEDPISQQCRGEERWRRRRRRCRTSSSVGAGVEQVDGGVPSLAPRTGGEAQRAEKQRKKKTLWG